MYTENQYEEFEKRMVETYPKMFAEPYGGFAVGSGWWPILESLCGHIQHHIDWKNKQSEVVAQVTVNQIKEKFGGLRFYITSGSDSIYDRISQAEKASYTICEITGQPGELRKDIGWHKTLCEEEYRKKLPTNV